MILRKLKSMGILILFGVSILMSSGLEVEMKKNYSFHNIKPEALPPKKGDLLVTQNLKKSWDGGFCNGVEILNTSNHPIDWEIDFVVEGKIITAWSSNYIQDTDTLRLLVSGLDWNNIVKPLEVIKFGYCADKEGNVIDNSRGRDMISYS